MTATDDLEKSLKAETLPTGTMGENDLIVHRLRDGQPLCDARGEVTEWRRAVTCFDCLRALDDLPENAERRTYATRMRHEGKGWRHIAKWAHYESAYAAKLDVEAYEERRRYAR